MTRNERREIGYTKVNLMDSTGTCDGVSSVGIPRKSSASTAGSCSATERCSQELEDYEVVEFDVRPPSGTNHQVLYYTLDSKLTFLWVCLNINLSWSV